MVRKAVRGASDVRSRWSLAEAMRRKLALARRRLTPTFRRVPEDTFLEGRGPYYANRASRRAAGERGSGVYHHMVEGRMAPTIKTKRRKR
jgi:hypothetical protein